MTTTATATVVSIWDEIGGAYGVQAADVLAELDAAPAFDTVVIRLNSPGGDALAGVAIYSALRRHLGTVSVIVDGLAASAASVVAMAASPGQLAVSPAALMMVHNPFALTVGDAADHREMAAVLDKVSDNIASIYAGRTGRPAQAWREAMRAETWYSADEAVAAGLADWVVP